MRGLASIAITGCGVALPLAARAQDKDAVKGAAQIFEFFRVSGVVPAIVVIIVAMVLLRTITALTTRFGERFTQHRLLAQQLNTMARFVIYIVAFILLIRALFVLDQQTILAMTGTIAVALGFALKDLAASVAAGIMILFDRPFQEGDRVTFGSHYGEITNIGLRSVRLTTLDDSEVTIPNNKFLTDVVVSGNSGNLDMQIVVDFFIAQDADLARAKNIVLEVLRTSRFVYLKKPMLVLVNDLIHESYLATRLRAKAYVVDVRHEKAFETDITERVKRGFAKADVRPPELLHRSAAPPLTHFSG
jgi:small-conductance mechanosensitive channel